MLLTVLSVIASMLLVVVSVMTCAMNEGNMPALALVIPMLWLALQGGVAIWVLLASMIFFSLTLSGQPLSLSISVWTTLPLLTALSLRRSSPHLIALIVTIVGAMQGAIMLLQYEGKIEGSAWLTLIQIFSVVLTWIAISCWKSRENSIWWPLLLVIPLWFADLQHVALIALSITSLMICLQNIGRSKFKHWLLVLAWLLPVIAFTTLIISPQFEVPAPVIVSWLITLLIGWITDVMLQVDNQALD